MKITSKPLILARRTLGQVLKSQLGPKHLLCTATIPPPPGNMPLGAAGPPSLCLRLQQLESIARTRDTEQEVHSCLPLGTRPGGIRKIDDDERTPMYQAAFRPEDTTARPEAGCLPPFPRGFGGRRSSCTNAEGDELLPNRRELDLLLTSAPSPSPRWQTEPRTKRYPSGRSGSASLLKGMTPLVASAAPVSNHRSTRRTAVVRIQQLLACARTFLPIGIAPISGIAPNSLKETAKLTLLWTSELRAPPPSLHQPKVPAAELRDRVGPELTKSLVASLKQ